MYRCQFVTNKGVYNSRWIWSNLNRVKWPICIWMCWVLFSEEAYGSLIQHLVHDYAVYFASLQQTGICVCFIQQNSGKVSKFKGNVTTCRQPQLLHNQKFVIFACHIVSLGYIDQGSYEWTGLGARMWEERNAYRILVDKLFYEGRLKMP
jgi:hypothetical protein